MLKMSSQIEPIVAAYKTLSKIPSIVSGKLNNSATRVSSKWSVRNIDKGKATKYLYNYVLDDKLNVIAESEYGIDASNEILSAVSPRETFKAIIREEKDSKDAKKQYLEVWSKASLAHSIDLTALDIHGDVYADSEFGALDWTQDESAVVYVAEKKLKKSEPYIKRKGEDKTKPDGSGEAPPKKVRNTAFKVVFSGGFPTSFGLCLETCWLEAGCTRCWAQCEARRHRRGHSSLPLKKVSRQRPKLVGKPPATTIHGEEYIYRQDWGEQLAGKHLSVIVVCKLETEAVTVLEGLPETWCPGQVRFSPDGKSVVGVAWETEPRRLGLIFCTNRPGFIFELTLDGKMTKLSSEGLGVRSPRYTPSGDLVWLQRRADGPHHACHALVVKKKDSSTVTPIIDIVQTDIPTANNECFYGIYSLALTSKCFSGDGKRIVFSTPQQNEVRSYVVDVDGGRIVDISNKSSPGSTSILDIKSDVILASFSNLVTPGQLYIARLPPQGQEADIKWLRLSRPCEIVPTAVANSTVEYLQLQHDNTDTVRSFSALYFSPKAESTKLPLIVWPHGGPHSGFVNSFSLEAALFSMLGFASLQINYRGSTGAGQASVEFLPKRVGDADVKDCKLATDHVLKTYQIDEKKVCLTGGSHGGFLVTHLSGQYPDLYRVVVTRNPVVDVASMYNSTDIADCLGFASVRLNYRGSIGRGDANVRSLIGNVGSYDVNDCLLTLTTLIERDRRLKKGQNWFLYGGSYGGFLVAHLAGLYPDMFRAMVLRNPLIDLATKGHYADNSDGCAVEAGFDFSERGPVSEKQLLAMRRCSPLVHVHKVRAPTALMLGSGDKRVPHYQGLEYSRRLKANGVPTRVYMYDDNHSLSSQPNEMDNLINGASWFLEHLQS